MVYRLGADTPAMRNPLLESVLPSLLYIKMVALLDDALTSLMERRGLSPPKKFPDSLKGRIDYLEHKGILSKSPQLHDVRERRNELAHETNAQADWAGVGEALDLVEAELQHLGVVGARPKYEAFAERSAMEAGDRPEVLFKRTYRYGLRRNGAPVVEMSWTERVLRD